MDQRRCSVSSATEAGHRSIIAARVAAEHGVAVGHLVP